MEDDPFGGEAIQVGGLNQGVAVGAAEHGCVLIGHDEQQIGPVSGSHGRVYLPASRLAQYTYAGRRLRTLPMTAGRATGSGRSALRCRLGVNEDHIAAVYFQVQEKLALV